MSAPSRPPVTTKFWIGDTVYKVHGDKAAGIVLSVHFQGDPAYPTVVYEVVWPKAGSTEEHYEFELTKIKPQKMKSYR
jgi:hypothetical protein